MRARHHLDRALRHWLDAAGLMEVHPPCVVPNPGMEPGLDAFAVRGRWLQKTEAWLHTSPELAIKASLAELDVDVVSLARCWRDEGPSRWHHREFTMMEWYRLRADYHALMRDIESVVQWLWNALDPLLENDPASAGSGASAGWAECLAGRPWPRVDWVEALHVYAGLDWWTDEPGRVAQVLARRGVDPGGDEDAAWLWQLAVTELVEPALAALGPCFLVDYPIEQAALARPCAGDGRRAERFEAYLPLVEPSGGRSALELANAFSELVDAEEQRRRFDQEQRQRAHAGGPVYPMPEAMLRGLEGLPTTAGAALGLERLYAWLLECRLGWRVDVADLLLPAPAGQP
jgi:lysyl-tRNA synthetase class 2